MKRSIIVSLGALAGLALPLALPLAAGAQDARQAAPWPAEAGSGIYEGFGPEGFGLAGYGLGDKLDMVRRHYSGKLIRFRLAGALATQETAIGIRADQQEAWRAYTQALLALVPEREAVLSLIGAPTEDPKGPEAFARTEALADALSAYAGKAETLKKAIVALRDKLTPEQLEAARVPRLVRG